MSYASADLAPLATTADLLALPDRPRHELLGGALVAKLLPAPVHGFFQGILGAELSGPFSMGRGGPGGWWFGAEVACELSPVDTPLPDLAGWRRDRLAGPPLGPVCRVVPDWVCEILSPGNPLRDLRDKLGIYQRAQVGWYWVLDPERRTLAVHRWTAEGYLVVRQEPLSAELRAEPFDAVALDLSGLLPPLPGQEAAEVHEPG